MSELRKMIDTLVPEWIDNTKRRKVLYGLFWATTAVMSWAFIVTNPVFGWFVAVPPVLLVWWTSARGLGSVNSVLLGATIVLALVPAFFLGMAQRSDELPTGGPLVGLLVFLVWVAAFPTMLDHVDRRFRRRVFRLGPDDELDRDPFVEVRLLLIRLWMAAQIMLVVDDTLAALVCVAALTYRGRATAVLAGLACLVLPLLSVEFGGVVWDAGVFDVIGAVLAALQWRDAFRNPFWGGGLGWPLATWGRR